MDHLVHPLLLILELRPGDYSDQELSKILSAFIILHLVEYVLSAFFVQKQVNLIEADVK